MEARSHAKATYNDVFGGAPKHSSSYNSKANEYSEIFGGIGSSSCSIPFLDLPDLNEEFGDVGFIDYGEIFGGFDAGSFAVDYEELVNERPRTGARFCEPSDNSNLTPESARNENVLSEKNMSLSGSNQSDVSSKQFNMSYHRANHGSLEDVLTGKTHITELHVVPGYTYTINSFSSSQEARSNSSSNIRVDDLTNRVSSNGRLNDRNEEKVASLADNTHNTKSYVAELKTNEEEFIAMPSTSEDNTLYTKKYSLSSSNNSASSIDAPYPDAIYVGISDINLRTQPSRLPPPSRAPPKVVMKQENANMKMSRNTRGDQEEEILYKPTWTPKIHYSIGSSKSQVLPKDDTSSFHDVEIDASSALAASAAAMKEAMEQAQARLKSAKELMERKRDKPHIRKKLSCKENTNIDEGRVFKAFEEEKSFSEAKSKKSLPKEDKGTVQCVSDCMQNGVQVGRAAPIHDEKYDLTAEESRQMKQGNGFKDVSNSGEWKTEKQFYELVSIVKKSEKIPEADTMINENEEHYTEQAELAYEFNDASIVAKADTIVGDEINDASKAHDIIHHEEIIKQAGKAGKISETCNFKENRQRDFYASCCQNDDEQFVEAQEALLSEVELKNDEATCEENELNVEFTTDVTKLVEIYLNEDTIKFHEVEEVCEDDDNEKESSKPSPTYVSCGCEDILKIPMETGVQHENKNDTKREEEVPNAFEGVYLHENSEYTEENGKAVSCHEENECKFESTSLDTEHEKCGIADTREACMPVENDFKTKLGQNDTETNEDFEELNLPATMGLGIIEENIKSAKESQVELQQKAEGTTSVTENTTDPGVLNAHIRESDNGMFKTDNGTHGSEDSHHTAEMEEDIVDAQQGSHTENEDLGDAVNDAYEKPQISSNYSKPHSVPVVTENINPDVRKREKLESEKAKEKETEQAKKAEEEKEREREREKDKLATERRAAQERAERMAVERATAEARQRALAGVKERVEKAAAEALEKSLAEKDLKEAKLRAERAAVERATAEARERAVEKALAEKAAADARLRAERFNNISREKEDRVTKLKASYSDVVKDASFQNAGSSSSSQRHADSSAPGEVESPLRCKARLERHQRTVERAAKALTEKNMRDMLVQREQAERNRLAESLDADVRRWSTGKEGNLRALLSTLQYILGPESGWQPIPLTEVITAVAVKKAYRKATLYVHPDKLQQRGATIQQKYICEKVFDLLKEAWNRFNSEER